MTIAEQLQQSAHLGQAEHTEPIQHIDDEACRRFQWAIELVGKRWSGGILLALARGATRFSEVLELVDGLSDRLLAARLKELEASNLVERTVVPTTPVQIRYRLTPRGDDLLRSMQPLHAWEQRWHGSANG